MTRHADTLRDEAKWLSVVQSIVVERSDRDALLAGAAALDTLTKVREVLDRLTAHADDLEALAQAGPRIEAAGIRTAITTTREALGGTP